MLHNTLNTYSESEGYSLSSLNCAQYHLAGEGIGGGGAGEQAYRVLCLSTLAHRVGWTKVPAQVQDPVQVPEKAKHHVQYLHSRRTRECYKKRQGDLIPKSAFKR